MIWLLADDYFYYNVVCEKYMHCFIIFTHMFVCIMPRRGKRNNLYRSITLSIALSIGKNLIHDYPLL